jgi:predicted AlkP superfamily pyrophosphatase or phosphodiesterase
MNKFFLWVFLITSVTHGQSRPPSAHVVLISIDGFHPDMYLDSTWPTPNLRQLMKFGTYADHMLSVFPAYTYPSHTSMLTGALPARSKITYNQPAGSKGEWNWEAKYIKSPAIWQALKAKGLTTAAVMWPGTVGGDITYNISEIWDIHSPEDRITATRRDATPGLVEEIERNATGKLDSTNMRDGDLSLDENTGRMAAHIYKTYKPAFLFLHFAEVDGFEHEQGRDGDSVRLAVEANDRAIGDILESIKKSGLKDSTTVIVVGDHGFSTIHTVFRPNILIQGIPAKFIAAGGSAFLYLKDSAVSAMTRQQVIRAVKDSLGTLPADKRKQFRFVDRPELDRLGADSNAIMALAAVPGLVFSGSVTPAKPVNAGPGTAIQPSLRFGLFTPVSGGHHGYDPNIPDRYTGFIAAGAGIRKGAKIRELCVTDIAPLVAKLLGIDFPCPDGKLVPGIVE